MIMCKMLISLIYRFFFINVMVMVHHTLVCFY